MYLFEVGSLEYSALSESCHHEIDVKALLQLHHVTKHHYWPAAEPFAFSLGPGQPRFSQLSALSDSCHQLYPRIQLDYSSFCQYENQAKLSANYFTVKDYSQIPGSGRGFCIFFAIQPSPVLCAVSPLRDRVLLVCQNENFSLIISQQRASQDSGMTGSRQLSNIAKPSRPVAQSTTARAPNLAQDHKNEKQPMTTVRKSDIAIQYNLESILVQLLHFLQYSPFF